MDFLVESKTLQCCEGNCLNLKKKNIAFNTILEKINNGRKLKAVHERMRMKDQKIFGEHHDGLAHLLRVHVQDDVRPIIIRSDLKGGLIQRFDA
jgi:hypothetical protein